MNRRSSVLGWLGVIAPSVAILSWAGSHGLEPPPLTEPSSWGAWYAERDPVVATFSVVRLAALGAGWYLGAVLTAGLTARLARLPKLVAATDVLMFPALRRAVVAAVAMGAASTGVTATASTRLPQSVAASFTAPFAAQPSSGDASSPPPTITMRPVPEPREPATTPAPDSTTPDPGGGALAAQSQPAVERWTVEPGQCFWTIAESVLAEALGRPPSDAEVVPYWLRLIESNRAELVDPGNADLIYPGQVFTVPTP